MGKWVASNGYRAEVAVIVYPRFCRREGVVSGMREEL